MAKITRPFRKVKTLHTILPEFHDFLWKFEEHESIQRIIPARISRQQKGSSDQSIRVQYKTPSGRKLLLKKGSTAQELFVICVQGTDDLFLQRCIDSGCLGTILKKTP